RVYAALVLRQRGSTHSRENQPGSGERRNQIIEDVGALFFGKSNRGRASDSAGAVRDQRVFVSESERHRKIFLGNGSLVRLLARPDGALPANEQRTRRNRAHENLCSRLRVD